MITNPKDLKNLRLTYAVTRVDALINEANHWGKTSVVIPEEDIGGEDTVSHVIETFRENGYLVIRCTKDVKNYEYLPVITVKKPAILIEWN